MVRRHMEIREKNNSKIKYNRLAARKEERKTQVDKDGLCIRRPRRADRLT